MHTESRVSGCCSMTCASCAARIEKTLNKLDGVSATVQAVSTTPTPHPDAGHGQAAAGVLPRKAER